MIVIRWSGYLELQASPLPIQFRAAPYCTPFPPISQLPSLWSLKFLLSRIQFEMKISSVGKLLMQPTLCKLWANNESENYKEHDERNMILVKCARRNQFLQQRFVFQFSFSKAHIQNLNEPFALLQKCNFCRWKATPSFEVGLKSEGYFILWWSPVWWLISKVMIATISVPHLALL